MSLHVSYSREWLNRGIYGLMPVGERQRRIPTIAEVVHFHTCHAAGPYCAINARVPPWVPVWQYVPKEEIDHAARICMKGEHQ